MTDCALAAGWRTATIEEISEKVAMGPFGSSIKVETFVPEGVPIINGQHLHGSRVDDSPGFNFICYEHAHRLANANVIRGDIVLTHRGTIGQVAYIPEDSQFHQYVVSQSQFYVRCDRTKVVPEFVALYLKSPEGQHQLLANTSQVGVPSIAQPVTYLRTIPIPIPPLPEQRAIAHILGTLDDKIELNRRMNQTLEEMARALFKSWFVDFEPVRAKMDGRWRRGHSLPGMPAELYDLFPDGMVDSELGEVPEGWEVKDLGELFVSKSVRVGNDDVPEYSCTNEGVIPRSERIKKKLSLSKAKNKVISKGDFVFGLSRRVLNFGLMRDDVGCVSPAYRTYSTNQDLVIPELLERIMRIQSEYFYLAVSSSSREGQSISQEFLLGLQVTLPAIAIQKFLYQIIEGLSLRVELALMENRKLGSLRDVLLPKLISGEIDLSSSTST